MNDSPMSERKVDTRRSFLRLCGRVSLLAGLAALGGFLLMRRGAWRRLAGGCAGGSCAGCPTLDDCAEGKRRVTPQKWVWQLDPHKCIQCGRCATDCVLTPSAVKCVHQYAMCGYCKLCFGYFQQGAQDLTSAAENQMCPTGAIERTFIEEPYYEYRIQEALCVGCGRCVKGCGAFGNGSLFLQVRHNRCLNCNECSIAKNCPAEAYRRVPASEPYLMKGTG